MTQSTEKERAEFLQLHADFKREFGEPPEFCKWTGIGYRVALGTADEAVQYAARFDGYRAAWQAVRRAQVAPTGRQIEQYLREQGVVTVSREVAEAAGLARLAGKMQADRSAPVVPPGWKLVPVEATQAMYEAAASFGGRGGYSRQRGDDALEVWEEMLAAAPQPPACNSSMQPELATYSAPVQLPDPVAVVYLNRIQYSTAVWHGQIPDGTKLYTEHQLRQLLAQHGITGSSHGQPT